MGIKRYFYFFIAIFSFFCTFAPSICISMIIKLYNNNPNAREVNRIADLLNQGGIIIIPTDTLYAFACSMQHRKSVETIAQLKGFSTKQARYSMLCHSISQASEYVRPMSRDMFQFVKECLPGPFTFIMDANNEVPRNYQNPGHSIGIRVPDNNICNAIIQATGCPLICTSVRQLNNDQEKEYITDPELIHESFSHLVDAVIDGGIGEEEPSTVINCSDGELELIRQGKGILSYEI